jgi:flagellar hook-basal body complex protein FliE
MDGGFTVSNANRFLQSGSFGNTISGADTGMSQSGISGSSEVTGKSFADTLKEAIGSVNALQKNADVQMQNLATGRTDNVAEVMIATEQADIALKLMVQVRNKIIDAYQEIMKMQV